MKHLIEKELGRTTQTSLAREIGISQATIHKILYTDTIMTVPILRKLARYFKVPLTHLLDSVPAGGDERREGDKICDAEQGGGRTP